jgi:type IV secretion system protein VirB2
MRSTTFFSSLFGHAHRATPRASLQLLLVVLLLAVSAAPALGAIGQMGQIGAGLSGGGAPWEGPLNTVMASIQGPVAKALGVVAIVLVGVGFAFSEGGHVMRKALWAGLGLAVAFNASSWVLPQLAGGGAAGLLV